MAIGWRKLLLVEQARICCGVPALGSVLRARYCCSARQVSTLCLLPQCHAHTSRCHAHTSRHCAGSVVSRSGRGHDVKNSNEESSRLKLVSQGLKTDSAVFSSSSSSSSTSSTSSFYPSFSESIVTPQLRELLAGVGEGHRARLAAAITLVESKHPVKHRQAQWLLTKILSQRNKQKQLGTQKETLRIGLSGPPGAGKSTLIESFGRLLTSQGLKVAVLAVDPSSSRSGGSILGDKTRMPKLTRDKSAYIRPSPSGGSLGGVNRTTGEAVLLCEGAGYDVIIVETVGVGQSETAVSNMVDVFTLIIPPAAGDELQGLKKGIVEVADLVVVNKADGDLLPAARRIKAEYVSALKLIRSKTPHWRPKVLLASALSGEGIPAMWEETQKYCAKMKEVGEFVAQRRQQQTHWLWSHVEWQLRHRFRTHPAMARHISNMEERVMAGLLAPGTAADLLLNEYQLILRN